MSASYDGSIAINNLSEGRRSQEMKIMCAWCSKDLGEKPPFDDPRVTHSICKECKDKHFGEGNYAKENRE